MLLVLFGAAYCYSPARTWFFGEARAPLFAGSIPAQQPQPREVPLLPFDVPQLMLPGEQRSLDVEDAAIVSALEQTNVCGQMLIGRGGEVSAVAPLLEVEHITRAAAAGNSWQVRVRCVARVRVLDLRQPNAEQKSCLTALAQLYADETEDALNEQAEMTAALQASTEQDEQTSQLGSAAAKAVAASAEAAGVSPDAVVEACQHLLDNLDAEVERAHAEVARMQWQLGRRGSAALGALVSARRATLGDGGQAPLLDTYAELWNVRSEGEAERVLLSFASLAQADPGVRMHALLAQSATERMTIALCALREAERRAAAMVALRGVAESKGFEG